MAFIGLDQRVAGYLTGGMDAWTEAEWAVIELSQISVEGLSSELQNGRGMATLDVRESSEWRAGHIAGAHRMSYKQLPERFGELELATDRHVAVICGTGSRSSTACSILQREGFENLYNVSGGMSAWAAAKLPMVDNEGCAVCAPRTSISLPG